MRLINWGSQIELNTYKNSLTNKQQKDGCRFDKDFWPVSSGHTLCVHMDTPRY